MQSPSCRCLPSQCQPRGSSSVSVRNDSLRTLSDMATVALLAAGPLPHFELAVAYEILGNPPLGVTNGWYDLMLCGPEAVQVGPFRVEPTHGLDDLVAADTVIVPACPDV